MAYLPFLDILRSYFEIKEGEQEFLIKRKMQERLRKFDEKLLSILSPLQDLLSLKIEDEEDLGVGQPANEIIQKLLRGLVDPVEVLDGQDERSFLAFSEE